MAKPRAQWLVLLAAASCMLATPARAMQSAGNAAPTEETVARDIRAQEDPTIITNRVWLEYEWNNNHDGATAAETSVGMRLGWRLSDNHDVGLQIEQMFNRDTTEAPGEDLVEQGVGDLKVNVGTALRLAPNVRIGGGVEIRLPVGDDNVSSNIWRMQEYVAVAWDARPWLTITPKLRHYHTLAVEEGGRTSQYWEINLPATFALPGRWSLTTRYEIKIDEISDYTTHSAKFTIGRQFRQPRLGLSMALKVPFNSQSNDYQLVFNATMSF